MWESCNRMFTFIFPHLMTWLFQQNDHTSIQNLDCIQFCVVMVVKKIANFPYTQISVLGRFEFRISVVITALFFTELLNYELEQCFPLICKCWLLELLARGLPVFKGADYFDLGAVSHQPLPSDRKETYP